MRSKSWLSSGVFVAVTTFATTAEANPARGYFERACGFDLDDDGIVGEATDDCRVCDGITTDPDGDGVDEDLIYVDCDGGADSGTCGDPDNPCATVTHALEVRMDGPGDGAEDIVCFTGTCSPEGVKPAFGGLTDVRTVPASGSESRDFEVATDPAMLVGWDLDADGEYPPFDADDVAVLDGTGLQRAISVRNSSASHFEFAHFEAREYGRVGNQGGFFAQGPSHNYVHDIELSNINREMPTPSGRIVFDFFSSQNNHYFWAQNIDCEHCGGYFVRGAGGNGPAEAGPFRFQGISLTMHPCSYGSSAACDAQPYSTIAKLWGYMRGVEFIDSTFDGDPLNRTLGNHPSHLPSGIGMVNCAQDFVVRNNTFRDTQGMFVQGYAAGFCDGPEARPSSEILFENNYVVFEDLGKPTAATSVQPVGQVAGAQVGEVTIRHNIFRSTVAGGMRTCFTYSSGNTVEQPTDLITFEDNRCEGSQGEAVRLMNPAPAMAHQDYSIRDNVFVDNSGQFISAAYGPSAFDSDDNLFGSDASFRWDGGGMIDLAEFVMASGSNAGSTQCPDGSCIPPVACGDGTCDPDEDSFTCPEDCDDGDDGGPDDGGADDGGSGGDGDGDGDGGGADGGGSDGSGGADAGSDAGMDTEGDGDGADQDGSQAEGCTCRTTPGTEGTPSAPLRWTALMLVLLGVRRRRTRRSTAAE